VPLGVCMSIWARVVQGIAGVLRCDMAGAWVLLGGCSVCSVTGYYGLLGAKRRCDGQSVTLDACGVI